MELEEEGAPISLTLIKPSSIDTPFFDKARSHIGVEPQPAPPVYAPELVADAILTAAERPVRDVIVGGSGRILSMSSLAPRVTDTCMARNLFDSQKTDQRVLGRPDNLFGPVAHDGGERGHYWKGRTIRRSASPSERGCRVRRRRLRAESVITLDEGTDPLAKGGRSAQESVASGTSGGKPVEKIGGLIPRIAQR